MKTLQNLVIDAINNLDGVDLIELNNTYCRENNIESEIYENDEEFFNTFFENKPNEAVRAAHFGKYNFADNYVQFNGYGNLDSLNYMDTDGLCERVDVIAEWCIDNPTEIDGLIDISELESELIEESES